MRARGHEDDCLRAKTKRGARLEAQCLLRIRLGCASYRAAPPQRGRCAPVGGPGFGRPERAIVPTKPTFQEGSCEPSSGVIFSMVRRRNASSLSDKPDRLTVPSGHLARSVAALLF